MSVLGESAKVVVSASYAVAVVLVVDDSGFVFVTRYELVYATHGAV